MTTPQRPWVLLAAIVVMMTIGAGAAGWFTAARAPVEYESSTRLLVGPAQAELDTLRAADLLTQTYAQLLTSQLVIERTIQRTNADLSVDELSRSIDTTADGSTRLLHIRVRHADPRMSQTLANTLVFSLRASATALDQGVRPQLQVIDEAGVGEPVPSGALLVAMLAGVAGLLTGLGMTVLVVTVSDRRAASRSSEDTGVTDREAQELLAGASEPIVMRAGGGPSL